jgi:hypothetical protein
MTCQMKLELRGSSFNGTETLLIRIEGIDRFSYLRGVSGCLTIRSRGNRVSLVLSLIFLFLFPIIGNE